MQAGLPCRAPAFAVLFLWAVQLLFGCAGPAGTTTARAESPLASVWPPPPSLSRIDYAHPELYVALPSSVGDPSVIRRAAREIRGSTGEQRLAAIGIWLRARLRHDSAQAYRWRAFEHILAAGTYGSCADHAVMFGALARAVGIPTVWVKAMDADWIREFTTAGGEPSSWRGHVFLEVFVDGRWMLLDASSLTLYRNYSPGSRLLPGDRVAYDKGADPRALILSTDWERWKLQTRRYFHRFDTSQLPVPPGRALRGVGDVYVVADAPAYTSLTRRYTERGWDVRKSFNTAFDQYLPQAAGSHLVVTVVGEHFVLPERYWPRWTGISALDVRRLLEERAAGMRSSILSDGTRVTVLYARSVDELTLLIEGLGIDAPR